MLAPKLRFYGLWIVLSVLFLQCVAFLLGCVLLLVFSRCHRLLLSTSVSPRGGLAWLQFLSSLGWLRVTFSSWVSEGHTSSDTVCMCVPLAGSLPRHTSVLWLPGHHHQSFLSLVKPAYKMGLRFKI